MGVSERGFGWVQERKNQRGRFSPPLPTADVVQRPGKRRNREEMSRAPVSLAPLRASGSLHKPPDFPSYQPPADTSLVFALACCRVPMVYYYFFVVGLFRVSLSSLFLRRSLSSRTNRDQISYVKLVEALQILVVHDFAMFV